MTEILQLTFIIWGMAMIPLSALTILGFGIFWYFRKDKLTDDQQTVL